MGDIELVIKIPEELKQALDNNEEYRLYTESVGHVMLTAIKKGTPLPKGHGRLIDADKTILKICGSSCGCHLEECGRDVPCFSVARVASAPTIIEADKESEET